MQPNHNWPIKYTCTFVFLYAGREKKAKTRKPNVFNSAFHCVLISFLLLSTCNFYTFPHLFVGVSSILPVFMLLFDNLSCAHTL